MGRDKKNERRGEKFTKMHLSTMETPAWRALSTTAQALYPFLKLEWKGPNASNNGKITLSVRQAAKKMGITSNTAMKGFHELQAKGFIVQTSPASLGTGGAAKAPRFEITEIVLPESEKPDGRKLYRDWRPNEDFPVKKASQPVARRSKNKTPS